MASVSRMPSATACVRLASLVAIVVGTIWLATFFFDEKSYLKLHLQLRPHGDMWGRILKIGLPAGVEFALVAVYLFLVYTISRPFGAAAQAGFGIGQVAHSANGLVPAVGMAHPPRGGTPASRLAPPPDP